MPKTTITEAILAAANEYALTLDHSEFDARVEHYREDQHTEFAATYYAFVDLYGEDKWVDLTREIVAPLIHLIP